MPAGQTWPAEWETYEDWVSGARVRRLTDDKGHGHHLYVTNPGWTRWCLIPFSCAPVVTSGV